MVTPTAQKLLEAHIAFEVAQWAPAHLPERIEEEVQAFQVWAQTLTLNDIAEVSRIQQFAAERVLDGELAADLLSNIGSITNHLLGLQVNRDTTLQDIIDDQVFNSGVELAIELRHLREEIMGQAVESPIYAMLVGEILYNGIKAYLATSSKILGKGASMLGKSLSVLDNQVEKRLRSWIEANAGGMARQSRKFLEGALTDDRIRELAEEVWTDLRDSPLSVRDALQDEDVDAIVQFGKDVWLHLRETDYLQDLVGEGIAMFFRTNGQRPFMELLSMVGVSTDILRREGNAFAPRLVETAMRDGYLEAMVRRRLTPFYASEAAKDLLG